MVTGFFFPDYSSWSGQGRTSDAASATSPWVLFSWRESMTRFWSGLSTIRSPSFWLTRLTRDTSGIASSLIMTTLPFNVRSPTAMFCTTSHSLQSYLYSMMDLMWTKMWCTLNVLLILPTFFILEQYNAPCLLNTLCYHFVLSFAVHYIIPFCQLSAGLLCHTHSACAIVTTSSRYCCGLDYIWVA